MIISTLSQVSVHFEFTLCLNIDKLRQRLQLRARQNTQGHTVHVLWTQRKRHDMD